MAFGGGNLVPLTNVAIGRDFNNEKKPIGRRFSDLAAWQNGRNLAENSPISKGLAQRVNGSRKTFLDEKKHALTFNQTFAEASEEKTRRKSDSVLARRLGEIVGGNVDNIVMNKSPRNIDDSPFKGRRIVYESDVKEHDKMKRQWQENLNFDRRKILDIDKGKPLHFENSGWHPNKGIPQIKRKEPILYRSVEEEILTKQELRRKRYSVDNRSLAVNAVAKQTARAALSRTFSLDTIPLARSQPDELWLRIENRKPCKSRKEEAEKGVGSCQGEYKGQSHDKKSDLYKIQHQTVAREKVTSVDNVDSLSTLHMPRIRRTFSIDKIDDGQLKLASNRVIDIKASSHYQRFSGVPGKHSQRGCVDNTVKPKTECRDKRRDEFKTRELKELTFRECGHRRDKRIDEQTKSIKSSSSLCLDIEEKKEGNDHKIKARPEGRRKAMAKSKNEKALKMKKILQNKYIDIESEDESYSDEEKWKDIKLTMKKVNINGIMKKDENCKNQKPRNVTFNKKVKKTYVFCM